MPIEAATIDRARPGKYLSCALGREDYGLEIRKIEAIIETADMHGLPRTPDYVRGIATWRGRSVPVIDLRRRLALPETAPVEHDCIVVVQMGPAEHGETVGVVVDAVVEVLSFTPDQIEPADVDIRTPAAVTGRGTLGAKAITLLDIDRVLDARELAELVQLAR